MKKIQKFFKEFFTTNIVLKLVSIVLAAFVVVMINIV